MQQGGEFYSKKYLFYYYTHIKQIIDLSPEDLDNLVLHPPPFNIISTFMFFCLPCKPLRKRCSLTVESLIYWADNITLSLLLMLFEMCIAPLIYLKIIY